MASAEGPPEKFRTNGIVRMRRARREKAMASEAQAEPRDGWSFEPFKTVPEATTWEGNLYYKDRIPEN